MLPGLHQSHIKRRVVTMVDALLWTDTVGADNSVPTRDACSVLNACLLLLVCCLIGRGRTRQILAPTTTEKAMSSADWRCTSRYRPAAANWALTPAFGRLVRLVSQLPYGFVPQEQMCVGLPAACSRHTDMVKAAERCDASPMTASRPMSLEKARHCAVPW